MTNQFHRALCKMPPFSMASGITTQQEKVDPYLAREQYAAYVSQLRHLGLDVIVLEADESLPDSHFVEDAAIIYQNVAIMTCPGAKERRQEVQALKSALQDLMTVTELGGHEALLDGGDVLFLGKHVYIGLSHRTNEAGAARLQSILTDIDPNLSIYTVAFEGVLHLKSGMTAINNHTLLGNPAMLVHHPLPAGTIQWLSSQEGYAANALTVNGSTMYFAECLSANKVIKSVGLQPLPMDMSEFRKMDGSFTCLSLLW